MRTRRRSFLPWPHKSKSKEKLISKSTEELDKRERKKSMLEVLTPSVSSYQLSRDRKKNSRSCSDVCAGYENATASSLCRVTLPDSSTTIASLVPGQPVSSWVDGLLKRRGIMVSEFEVLDADSGVALDIGRDCVKLSNREVRVNDVSVIVSFPFDEACDTTETCGIDQNVDDKSTSTLCDESCDFPINSSQSKPLKSFTKSCQLNCPHSLEVTSKEEKDNDNDGLEEEEVKVELSSDSQAATGGGQLL
jgi:hypothetical protein